MQNDTLMALLLDPFLTFDEVMKECRATPEAAHASRPARVKAAPRFVPRTVHRPERVGVRDVPVIHHPPAARQM